MFKIGHEGLVVNPGCSPAAPCSGCDACGLQRAFWARGNLAVHYRGGLADKIGACLRTVDAYGETHEIVDANRYPVKGGEKWCAEGNVGRGLGRLAVQLRHWPANDTWYVAGTDNQERIVDINGLPADPSEPPSTLHFCVGCREHYDHHPSTRSTTRYVTGGFNESGEMTAYEVHTHPQLMQRWRGVQAPIPSAPPLYALPAY